MPLALMAHFDDSPPVRTARALASCHNPRARNPSTATQRVNKDLLSRVGPFGRVPVLSKAVSVHVSNVRVRGEAFVVQLRWSASGPTELFPVMEADLEIAPMGAHQSQLGFSGSYDPPLGSFGRQLDRLLLHQLAEATVRAMLRQLVAALVVEPAPQSAPAFGLPSSDPRPTAGTNS